MRQGPVLFDRDNLAAQIRGDGDVVLLRARHSDRDLAGIGLRLHRDRSRCEGQVDLACVRRSPRRSRPSPVPTIRTAAVFSVSLVSGPITELPPGAPPMSTATRAGVEPTNRKQMVATQHDSRTESHTRRVRRNVRCRARVLSPRRGPCCIVTPRGRATRGRCGRAHRGDAACDSGCPVRTPPRSRRACYA